MGTRSAIAIEYEGVIKAIYCHWDGYLEHNGKILNESYQDTVKIAQLIKLGNISSLGKNIVPVGAHSFTTPEKGCTVFYGRDRGEEGNEFAVFTSRDDFINGIDGEFFYLYTGGQWLVSEGKYWKVLKDEIESMIEDDAQ